MREAMDFSDGKTLTAVTGLEGGSGLRMNHDQDCCEQVAVAEIHGDPADLLGTPILHAEESTNSDNPPKHADSWTWTFYRLQTIKGAVQIRWLGESNGYYGEGVTLSRVAP